MSNTPYRARSPLDQMEYLGDHVELPLPPLPVGTVVEFNPKGMHPSDMAYYKRLGLKLIIQDTKKIVRSLRRQGFASGDALNAPLPKFNTDKIRQIAHVVANAHTMEIAGWKPKGMHVVGTLGHQSYLQDGQCHSGVSYEAYLLFRCTLNGSEVVYICPHAIVSSRALRAKEKVTVEPALAD